MSLKMEGFDSYENQLFAASILLIEVYSEVDGNFSQAHATCSFTFLYVL
jgi:hypothetical protein